MGEPFDPKVRIAALERALQRQRTVSRELEKLVEDRTRELYVAMERVKRQARLVGARTALALLGECGTLAAAGPRMLAAFGEELDWQVAHLWVVDRNVSLLHCITQWSAPGVDVAEFRAQTAATTFARGIGLPGRVWASGKAAWIEDVVVDANFPRSETARLHGLHCGCAFPILVDGEVVAAIEMFATESRAPDDDLVQTFNALGTQIGQFIERSRTQDQLRFNELQIARRIQTSILPRDQKIDGLEVAAMMVPATEVGGDYYDVLPFRGGTWLGIGDVSGHGVAAGMIMIMAQSAIAALAARAERPLEIVVAANELLYDRIHRRMGLKDYLTLTILRYTMDGRVTFAGAHEDLLIWRARTRSCEQIMTPGAWLGIKTAIDDVTFESELQLERGDVLVLYTDGVTEARDDHNEQFGIARLATELSELASLIPAPTVSTICDHLIGRALRWGARLEDDASVIVARYVGG
jgi:serine phosphatase RsbU (regulator of sigma subunit)